MRKQVGGWLRTAVVLSIQDVSKSFRTAKEVANILSQVRLTVHRGEIVSVIGPSGCGKSTLLKIIAGLDVDFDGEVLLEGKRIEQPSREKGFIFQEHRLFPWLTVEGNIAGDLSLRDPEVRNRVNELIGLVKLMGYEKAFPRQLSGGMSQRVAIARALQGATARRALRGS